MTWLKWTMKRTKTRKKKTRKKKKKRNQSKLKEKSLKSTPPAGGTLGAFFFSEACASENIRGVKRLLLWQKSCFFIYQLLLFLQPKTVGVKKGLIPYAGRRQSIKLCRRYFFLRKKVFPSSSWQRPLDAFLLVRKRYRPWGVKQPRSIQVARET